MPLFLAALLLSRSLGLPTCDAKLFISQKVDFDRLRQLVPKSGLAPLEPVLGCYIGAFIAREDVMRVVSNDGRDLRDPRDFEKIVGKRHAVYFNYLNLEKTVFHETEALLMRERNAAYHIALEPDKLSMVQDGPNSTLRRFARAVAESQTPVFIRFASEMNGNWTRKVWDVTPEGYVRAFRLIATVCREEMRKYQNAHLRPDGTRPPDNVAMVWSPSPYGPNPTPFYPGKEYVDWVGINFYSVLHRNSKSRTLQRSSEFENPLDEIPFVYDRWAKDHPIMISEWAATQASAFSAKPRPDFAVNKIGQLYGGAPRRFPRLKCINYFTMNSFKYAAEGRKTNNFSLFVKGGGKFGGEAVQFDKRSKFDSSEPVAAQYSRLIENPYFLRKVVMANAKSPLVNSPIEYAALEDGRKVSGDIELSALVRSDVERPRVTLKVAGKPVLSEVMTGDYRVTIPTTSLPNGPTKIVLTVQNEKGTTTVQRTINVVN